MTYEVTVMDAEGRLIANLGSFPIMAAARQAMLDHANVVDLPTEDPWFGPSCNVLEGWFVGRTEYLIGQA